MVGAILACAQNRVELQYLESLLQKKVNKSGRAQSKIFAMLDDDCSYSVKPKWKLAESQGLCLTKVKLVPIPDDPWVLMYPGMPHDADGKLIRH